MHFNFKEFPLLITNRLRLRKITKHDGPAIFFLRTDQEVNRYIYRPKPHKNVNEAVTFIDKLAKGMENGKNINWGITLPEDDTIIGSICLWNFSVNRKNAEVGYDLHPKFQGHGIMWEALKRIIEFGFSDLKLDVIEAFTHQDNIGSQRLLKSHNFVLNEGRRDEKNGNNVIFERKKPSINHHEIENIDL